MPRQIIELGGMYISEEPGLSYLVNKSPTSRSLISQYQVLRFPMKALLMPCLGISKRCAQYTVASTIIYQNNPRLVLHLQLVLLNQLHSWYTRSSLWVMVEILATTCLHMQWTFPHLIMPTLWMLLRSIEMKWNSLTNKRLWVHMVGYYPGRNKYFKCFHRLFMSTPILIPTTRTNPL